VWGAQGAWNEELFRAAAESVPGSPLVLLCCEEGVWGAALGVWSPWRPCMRIHPDACCGGGRSLDLEAGGRTGAAAGACV
jgi:hypothetical protein